MLAWLLAAPAANAQAQTAPPGLSDHSPNLSDEKLDAAAVALGRAAGIQQDYERRIAEAAPFDKKRIVDEARDALVTAITAQGLSLEEYTSILEMALNDPELRDRIFKRLDRWVKERSPGPDLLLREGDDESGALVTSSVTTRPTRSAFSIGRLASAPTSRHKLRQAVLDEKACRSSSQSDSK
jgi:hypothetical protein